jgi:hypothetical protein
MGKLAWSVCLKSFLGGVVLSGCRVGFDSQDWCCLFGPPSMAVGLRDIRVFASVEDLCHLDSLKLLLGMCARLRGLSTL